LFVHRDIGLAKELLMKMRARTGQDDAAPPRNLPWQAGRPFPLQHRAGVPLAPLACAILDTIPQQLAVLDGRGIIVSANAAWLASPAHKPWPVAPAIGASLVHATHQALQPELFDKVVTGLAGILARQLPGFAIEFELTAQDATGAAWYRIELAPISQQWPGAIVKISDFSRAREQETQERIAAIAFESQQGMLVTDLKGRIVRLNAAFTTITGYALEDVLGKNPSILSSGRHGPDFYRAMWDAIGCKGMWEGEIWNRRKNGDVYPEHLRIVAVRDESGSTSHYVASLSDITSSKAASDEIRHLAFYDPLTHLPNRRLMMDRLHQAVTAGMRQLQFGALLFIDLDNFKTLNDTLGHSTGDLLLIQVALRLRDCVRSGDTVARLGGDEFVIVLEALGSNAIDAAARARYVAAKILSALSAPFQLGGHSCRSSPSIGITLLDNNCQEAEQLLMQGDIAMYGAKQAGRNNYCFYDQEMQKRISTRAALDADLRAALGNKEFVLFYQRQVNGHGVPVGAEALIRWRKRDGSFVAPDQFIPLAEENGLIIEIGTWVLEQACAQLEAWGKVRATAGIALAVNVSGHQFMQNNFAAQVKALVGRYDFNPALLKLELTEGVLVDTSVNMIECMNQLRAIGLRFSLDDFGTGYSSLQYLKRLPLDQLKIDQSFVRELASNASDQAIVQTIIAMAGSLKLDVIAEGVETTEQRDLLAAMGCHHYQGFLYGKPVPAAQLFPASGEPPCHCQGPSTSESSLHAE
jgi:diguanylate cyclase (GGDEF)-like protein/PAS domain S-box-containing protein